MAIVSFTFKKNNFDVVICDYPYFEPLLGILSYKMLIYRPTDDYLQMSGDKVKYYERKIIAKSDIVIGTSQDVIASIKNNIQMNLRQKIFCY